MRTAFTYLASHALSLLGNSIAAIALPLIVLQTTGSVLSAGALAASTAIPAFLVGLTAGVLIDRINRLTSSVIADIISAVAVAALPIVDAVVGLNLGWFIVLGIIGAIGDVPGMTAREAVLPAIVRESGMSAERLIGLRESLGALVIVIGPAMAGTLMVLFDGSTVLWITAATSLCAALLTLLIPRRVGAIVPNAVGGAASGGSGWAQLVSGWRALRSSRFLVAVTVLDLVMVAVLGGLQGILLPAHFTLIEQPGLFGFVLTALALGTLVGGGLFAIVGTRGRRRLWFVAGMLGTVFGVGAIVLLPPVAIIFAGAFLLGLSSGLFASQLGVLKIERVPEDMRGRIMGTQNSLMMLAAPLGLMLVATLTETWGLGVAGGVLGLIWLVAVMVALGARALRNLEPIAVVRANEVSVDEKS